MSYTSTQFIPHADGGCHVPNYWATAQILLPDVDGSHAVPMPGEPTALVGAVKNASYHLALAHLPAHRASPTGSVFILESNHHTTTFGFVGDFVAHTAKGPLMDFLIYFGANIIPLPDIPDIAYHHGLHALSTWTETGYRIDNVVCTRKNAGIVHLNTPLITLLPSCNCGTRIREPHPSNDYGQGCIHVLITNRFDDRKQHTFLLD
jgi:hypothetical protein